MEKTSLFEEKWESIKGYENFYQISNFGNIKRLERKIPHLGSIRIFKEKILTPSLEKKGYLKIRLSINNKMESFKIHRLVAKYFINNINNLNQINHIDGNKTNNHFSNLEWVSNRENKNHYFLSIKKTSKYPGVYLIKANNKWNARIRIGKNRYNLGRFDKEEDAAQAYIDAQIKYNIIDKYTHER